MRNLAAKSRVTFDKWEARAKNVKDSLIRPVLVLFGKIGLSPFLASLIALLLGFLAIYMFFYSKEWFLLLIVSSVVFDIIDGALARFENKVTGEGFWIDFAFDRILLFAMMVAIYFTKGMDDFIYLAAPILYLVETIIYIFIHKKIFNITVRTIYFVMVYFSTFYATLIAVITDVINLLLFLSYFIYESSTSSSRAQ